MLKKLYHYFCFSLLFLSVGCWVLRLPCKDESNFDVKEDGYALENYVLRKITSATLRICIEECVKLNRCKSINFKDNGADNCELNNNIKQAANVAHFKAKAGWAYLATSYNTSKIGSYCEAMDPCKRGELCIDSCVCPYYQCIRCHRCFGIKYEQYCETRFGSQATTNLALNKPATASSTFRHGQSDYPPTLANDGIISGEVSNCMITDSQLNPWWKVDLGATAKITAVAVISRNDVWHYRINPFDVRVGDNGENGGISNPYCVQAATIAVGPLMRLLCTENTCGRYVSIHLKKTDHLQLGEVQAFGVY